MGPGEYQRLAGRTEAEAEQAKPRVTLGTKVIRLIHAGAGIVTEGGEFWDVLKRHAFYGQQLDEAHLAEELGDLLWYVALACNALGLDMEEVMCANIRKLRARFPDKFSEDLAKEENRDRAAEQAAATRQFRYDGGREVELAKKRTKSEVIKARKSAVTGGCCNRFADQMSCDCLETALDDLNATPVGTISFEGKVCEECQAPATRATHDLMPDGNGQVTHWLCGKHARKAVQIGNFS